MHAPQLSVKKKNSVKKKMQVGLCQTFCSSSSFKELHVLGKNNNNNCTQILLLCYFHPLSPFPILLTVSWMHKAAFLRQLATCQE